METILQCGYMTGDTYAAAAYLLGSPQRRIVVLKDTKQVDDKTGMIEQVYRETGVSGRVVVVDLSGTAADSRQVYRALDAALSSGTWPRTDDANASRARLATLRADHGQGMPRTLRKIVTVTGRVAEDFRANPDGARTRMATAWGGTQLATSLKFELWRFMAGKFVGIDYDIRPHVVVLWSRQSGKRGGAHMEMDTSYQGIRQIARHFAPSGKATVLLAGDERPVRLRGGMSGKLRLLAAEDPHIIDVSEMWKEESWRTHFGNATFLAQFAFFHALASEFRVVHLGSRSGMLESMALLGMPTFYLEPTRCGSGDRMLAFERHGIPYSRIQLSAKGLPGLSARAVQYRIEGLMDDPRRPVPVVTREGFDRMLDRREESLGRNVDFLRSFGVRDRRGRFHGTAESGRVARQVAKLERATGDLFFRKDLDPEESPRTPDEVEEEMRRNRGFFESDLERIVERMEEALRN